jgi:addiction module HigA family antidote
MKNPLHPGFGIRVGCLEPYGLTITEGAKILGVTRQTLSQLVNEKSNLSWDMAIRLSKAFGSNPDQWMRQQFAYESVTAEERAKKIKVKPVTLELEPA